MADGSLPAGWGFVAGVELRAVPSNLALLCRPCHLWVHSRQNVNREFLAAEPALADRSAA